MSTAGDWRAHKLRPGDVEHNPREAEFFNVGTIDRGASLVREFIQNALDARSPVATCVRVRIGIGDHSAETCSHYYTQLKPHVVAANIPLPPELNDVRLCHLSLEDFGTMGLCGALDLTDTTGEKGDFYKFWWGEGQSSKAGVNAGRWGLGRTAYHASSRLRAFWGLTVREGDNRQLLLGKALLKPHQMDGATYNYAVFYTTTDYRPVENRENLQAFQSDFGLDRGTSPGLSVVIPAYHDEITGHTLLGACIQHYFYPLIRGLLRVEIHTPDQLERLDAGSITKLARDHDWSGTDWEGEPISDLMAFIEASANPDACPMIELQQNGTARISPTSFGAYLDETRTRFLAGDLVWLRAPVTIRTRDGVARPSFLDAYLQRDPSLRRSVEFYVRGGITIPGIRQLRTTPVRALLWANDEPVAEFLGDCESPAHTAWKERTEGFREKYEDAASTLRFIKNALLDVARVLDEAPSGVDRELLADVFNATEDTETGPGPSPVPPIPPARPQPLALSKTRGGFTLSYDSKDTTLPFQARVLVAYDIRRGSPFSHYDPRDFRLDEGKVRVRSRGGKHEVVSPNQLLLDVRSKRFQLSVTGFDEMRDIVTDVEVLSP